MCALEAIPAVWARPIPLYARDGGQVGLSMPCIEVQAVTPCIPAGSHTSSPSLSMQSTCAVMKARLF